VSEDRRGATGAQHVGVINAGGSGDERVHQRRRAPGGERGDRNRLLAELFKVGLFAEHTHQREPRIGHSVIVVEYHRQTRRVE
jgi:hypothetical protein